MAGVLGMGLIPFVGTETKTKQVIKPEKQTRTDDLSRLLFGCSHRDVNVAHVAPEGFFYSLQKSVTERILKETKLELRCQYPFSTNFDINLGEVVIQSDINFGVSVAYLKRWDIIARGIEMMGDNVIQKINFHKTQHTFISHIGLYNDYQLHRQRRFGCYVWVELQGAQKLEELTGGTN